MSLARKGYVCIELKQMTMFHIVDAFSSSNKQWLLFLFRACFRGDSVCSPQISGIDFLADNNKRGNVSTNALSSQKIKTEHVYSVPDDRQNGQNDCLVIAHRETL